MRVSCAARIAQPAEREVVAGDRPVALVGPRGHVRVHLAAGGRLEAREVERADDLLLAALHLHVGEAVVERQVAPRGGFGFPRHQQRPAAMAVVALARLHVGDGDLQRLLARAGRPRRAHAGARARDRRVADLRRDVGAHLIGEALLVARRVEYQLSIPCHTPSTARRSGVDRRVGPAARAQQRRRPILVRPVRVRHRVIRRLPARRAVLRGVVVAADAAGQVGSPVQEARARRGRRRAASAWPGWN